MKYFLQQVKVASTLALDGEANFPGEMKCGLVVDPDIDIGRMNVLVECLLHGVLHEGAANTLPAMTAESAEELDVETVVFLVLTADRPGQSVVEEC